MGGLTRYLLFGLTVLGLYGAAEYRGWSFSGAREARAAAPQSIRNNPGSYRPHYYVVGSRRYTGGK